MAKKNKAKTIPLYPNKELLNLVNGFENGSFHEFLAILLETRSETELQFVLEKLNYADIIKRETDGIDVKPALEKLWNLWNDFTLIVSRLTFSSQSPTKAESSEAETNASEESRLPEGVGELILEALAAHDKTEELALPLRAAGYNHIPAWPAAVILDQMEEISSSLGFNPFLELDQYMISIDEVLKKMKGPEKSKNSPQGMKEVIISINFHFAELFLKTWIKLNPVYFLGSKISAENLKAAVLSFRYLGFLISYCSCRIFIDYFDVTDRVGGLKQILRFFISELESENNSNDDEGELLSSKPEDEARDFHLFTKELLSSLADGFSFLGFNSTAARELATIQLCAIHELLNSGEGVVQNSELKIFYCYLSPFLVQGIREILCFHIADVAYDEDCWIDDSTRALALAYHDQAIENKSIFEEQCNFINSLGLSQSRISTHAFMEINSIYFYKLIVD